MRIFYSLLIVLSSALLALMPFTGATHALITDVKTDTFTVTTAPATTTATVQLYKSLYDDDLSSLTILSHDTADIPLPNSYNSTTRALGIIGLSANLTRSLEVSYDVDAVGSAPFVSALTVLTYPWLIIIALMALGGLVWLWAGPVKDKLSRG